MVYSKIDGFLGEIRDGDDNKNGGFGENSMD